MARDTMMDIKRYEHNHLDQWEEFVSSSSNGNFQQSRKFLSYHKDRFADHSLMVFDGNKLLACLPGVLRNHTFISHPGLGMAGILIKEYSTRKTKNILISIFNYLHKEGAKNLFLKSIPSAYISSPNAIEYYIMSAGGEKCNLKLSMIIDPKKVAKYNSYTRKVIREKSHLYQLREVSETDFYIFLADHLKSKYDQKPLHSLGELTYLKTNFPENIKCYHLLDNLEVVSGCCLFIYNSVLKLQYLFSKEGDYSRILLSKVIESVKQDHQYFDFGTSNSMTDGSINYGNLGFKESLGGMPMMTFSLKANVNNTLQYLKS